MNGQTPPSFRWLALFTAALILAQRTPAAAPPEPPTASDRMLAAYFRAETASLATNCLADIRTLADWQAKRAGYRRQLFEMLGLDPLPPRAEMKAVVTGRREQSEFAVENLSFQSLPGLYVTANLYLPKGQTNRVPAVLYVCGHGPVITNGVSYGNKVAYQHHGAWFARHGYACLIIDTVELGELQGIHHGTYRYNLWWWNSRGYTPAGVEAWDSIRALDYLQSRPEVDPQRLGVTGRSGGGAYSWWVAALDDRVQVAAPVAGITDLQNHVVDGCVEGHCDCMYIVNTYRWDYPQVAALVAPRPLLIANSDKDTIFPLDGVLRVHDKVRKIYALYGAQNKLGLLITEGPHKDTQDLQLPVLRWFNRFLKGEDPVIADAATKFCTPEQLKVFATLPADARNTNIHASFVPVAKPVALPKSAEDWAGWRTRWREQLEEKVFGGWPASPGDLHVTPAMSHQQGEVHCEAYDFSSQPEVRLRVFCLRPDHRRHVLLKVLDEPDWPGVESVLRYAFGPEWPEEGTRSSAASDGARLSEPRPSNFVGRTGARPYRDEAAGFEKLREQISRNQDAILFFAPRGVGPNAWTQNPAKQVQIRRRFMLLGQTLDSMRVWDIRRAVQALHQTFNLTQVPVTLEARGKMGVDALYAALFEPVVSSLDLWQIPTSHQQTPDYLNVLRVGDIPQVVALVAEQARLTLHQPTDYGWRFPASIAARFHPEEHRFTLLTTTEAR